MVDLWDSSDDDELPPPSGFGKQKTSSPENRRRHASEKTNNMLEDGLSRTFEKRLSISTPQLMVKRPAKTLLVIDSENETSEAESQIEEDDQDDSGSEDLVGVSDGFSTVVSPISRTGVRKSPTDTAQNKNNEMSAWEYDSVKDEYFLSEKKFRLPNTEWPKLRIPKDLYDRLYAHQKIGVQWMASVHNNSVGGTCGGICGDDMGLGKTYQTLTLLGGLMRAGTIRNALVVTPLSVMRTWENEAQNVLTKCCLPKVTVAVLSSSMKKERRQRLVRDALGCTHHFPYLVICTYNLVGADPLDFVSQYDQWDYCILDEGHKIKNPSTGISKGCARICEEITTHRLMLTGTPIQNNLKELWALFNWATAGRLLGPQKTFENRYGVPIENGRDKNASPRTIELAERANRDLQALLQPHFLQRLKSSVLTDLPKKSELVVWTHLSEEQRSLYEHYVSTGQTVEAVLTGQKTSPLEAITWLKKLCGHPLLVKIHGSQYDKDILSTMDPEDLILQSAKLQLLVSLVQRLAKSGHRTLIFSQSVRMLDIIQYCFVSANIQVSRIDGLTTERHRQRYVNEFNFEHSKITAMLLSTKAASLGLTLTGADRAIIFDPSWVPAEDSQAVDRCYRIGQKKEVTVYRFVAAGTVEERMYERQVHKDGIRRAVLTSRGSSTERHFNRSELRRLFQLAPAGDCDFLSKFQRDHSDGALGSLGKPSWLEAQQGVVGISSHDVVYSDANTISSKEHRSPFGGNTPVKPKTLGRSQRALTKAGRHIRDKANKENVPTPFAASSAVSSSDLPITPRRNLSKVDDILARVDQLRSARKPHFALNMALDASESASGSDKLQLLEQAFQVLEDLGWLDESGDPGH